MSNDVQRPSRVAELRPAEYGTRFWYRCPGCLLLHSPYIDGDVTKVRVWSWNQRLDRPTLAPSVRVQMTAFRTTVVCHSIITDGLVTFLTDSTHALAGQTVPLRAWEN